jgi:hypothetical protein
LAPYVALVIKKIFFEINKNQEALKIKTENLVIIEATYIKNAYST